MSKSNNENLIFDVTKFGGKVKIQDAYPELLPYKEYHKISTEEWKCAIHMTSVGGDFVKIKDQTQKMEAIFAELGLDKTKHAKIFTQGINHSPGNLMDACSFLIEYQNNHEFSAWYEMNKMYYELLRSVREPLNPKSDSYDRDFDIKLKRQDKINKMQEDLKKYETSLFGTAAMKAAAFRSKRALTVNWNEKYAQENQVE